MAFNLKEMSVDYKKLLKLVPSERAAAAESGLINNMISALTPGQLVSLFPRYYREKLPDVGNVNQYSSRLDVALSGGNDIRYRNRNSNYAEGPTLDEMKTDLLKKGINVDNAYEDVGAGALEGDPRVKYMKAIPTDQLAELGFTRVHDENGKTLIKAIPTKTSQMSDQEISNLISGTNVATENAGEKQRAILREANRLGVDPADLATVISYETKGTFDPNIMGGKGGNYKGLIQFGPDEQAKYLKPGMTFDEQMVAVGNFLEDRGYKKWLKDNPNASLMEKRTALYSTINAGSPHEKYWGRSDNGRDNVMTHAQRMFSDDSKNREQATGLMKDSYKKVDGNATPEQIAAARKDMEAQEMSYNEKKLAKAVYENQNKYYDTATPISTTGIMNPVGGSQEGTSILDPNAVPRSGGAPGSRSFGGPRAKGTYHTGVDLPGQVGDPVRAPADGTIRQIYKSGGNGKGYGYVMDIEFPDGTVHRYAHLGTDQGGAESAFAKGPDGKPLKVGDKVKSGQTFGYVGESGNAGYDFPHVHMEVIKKDYYEETGGRPPGREETRGSLEAGRIDPFDWYEQQEKRIKAQEEAKKAASVQVKPPATPPAASVESAVQSTTPTPVVKPETITPKPPVINSSATDMPAQNQGAMRPPMPPQQPVPQQSAQNPSLFMDMADGNPQTPPSQFRAFNNARLYDAQSTNLYNGHFA
jgi:murein DD-endopeptidase MepM/ murein hydrolase activator NlpD